MFLKKSSVIAVLFILFFQMLGRCDESSGKLSKLLLISLDGFRWNYLSRKDIPVSNLTNFYRFIREGCHASQGIKNIYVTYTFPNHYTLLTGLYAENHGIVANTFFDPAFNETFSINNVSQQSQSKWFDNGGEPIWVTNQLQGNDRRSGTIFWPCSYAAVKGVGITRRYGNMDYKVEAHTPYKERVDLIIKWFTDEYPINLGLFYIGEPDEEAHLNGPDSTQVRDKIIELDKIVGYLLKRIEEANLTEELNIIITSDHGMVSVYQYIDLNNYLDPNLYRSFDWNILPNKGQEEHVYQQLLNISKQTGHFKVYRKDDIPPEYHYSNNRRIMPIVIDPEQHYMVIKNKSSLERVLFGAHGYNNSLSDMHPLFLAMGPAFKKGEVVETFNNVDIYPLMCHILGLKPAPNNGSLDVVKDLLKEEKQNTIVTFATYIATTVLIAFIAGVFTMAACRQHRKMKRNQRLVLSSVPDGIKLSTLLQNEVQLPLLSESDDSLD